MKTKPFLLATAGSTVDGRAIDDALLKEMASSYDPKTYGARLNIEHIRGATGQAPFRAFGDVLELSTAEVDVNFNGKTEKRLGLFGTFDVTDEAKSLNDASQKVYPSIEIEPNFAGKGFAYLMGCALTDSPAAIATERLQFNRQMPGTINLSREESALLEFAEDKTGDAAEGLLSKFSTMLDTFTAKFTPAKPGETTPPAVVAPADPAVSAFDFNQIKPFFTELGTTIATEIGAMRTEFRAEVDALSVKFAKLEKEQEEAPDRNFRARPQGNGGADNYAGIF